VHSLVCPDGRRPAHHRPTLVQWEVNDRESDPPDGGREDGVMGEVESRDSAQVMVPFPFVKAQGQGRPRITHCEQHAVSRSG